jgi:hypothetical protein
MNSGEESEPVLCNYNFGICLQKLRSSRVNDYDRQVGRQAGETRDLGTLDGIRLKKVKLSDS